MAAVLKINYLECLVQLPPSMYVVFSMRHRKRLQVSVSRFQLLIKVELPPATFTFKPIIQVVEYVKIAFASAKYKE